MQESEVSRTLQITYDASNMESNPQMLKKGNKKDVLSQKYAFTKLASFSKTL